MAQELLTAQNWIEAGHDIALAIVARTWGSAPRRAGSLMLIRGDGTFAGSVSGGCVEGTVITEAITLLATNGQSTHKTLTFSVASEDAWSVGLACGGEIEIRLFTIATNQKSAIGAANKALTQRRAGKLSFNSRHNTITFSEFKSIPSKHAPYAENETFVLPVIPALRIDIVGAVHIAQHLAAIASECGFAVRIIDPRSAFTDNRTFSNAEMINAWPDEFFQANTPDATTAVVTLTHDPKLDDATLNTVLESSAFYIGCLGGKKTHAARLKRLSECGHSQASLDTIHGPVGLDINAATPAEIAVSVLAEMIKTAHNKP